MDQPRIAVLDDYGGVARASADWSAVDRRAAVTFFPDHLDDRVALRDRLAPFDAICVMRERTAIDADLLAALPRLRFIGSTGPRNVAIDVSAARARGITVSTTGAHPTGTPELTWALILAAARALPTETASVRDGGWQRGLAWAGEGERFEWQQLNSAAAACGIRRRSQPSAAAHGRHAQPVRENRSEAARRPGGQAARPRAS